MPTLQSQIRSQQSQAPGNFAFTDERLDELFARPSGPDQSGWEAMAQEEVRKEMVEDGLAPAKGIINGLRLSVTLWSLLVLVFLLVR